MVDGSTLVWEDDSDYEPSRARFPWGLVAIVVVLALAAFLIVRLLKKPPGLFVTSTPPGAHVVIDGKTRGKTPLSLPDYVGSGLLVLRLRGEDVHEGRIRVLWNERKELDLTIGTGALLYVDSTPPFAAVWIDGRERAQRTPAMITDLAPGDHAVRIVSDDYLPHDARTAVALGEITTVDARLTRRLVRFTLNGPPDAFVTLVRRDNPETRYGIRLNADGTATRTIEVGRYTLRAVHVNYRALTMRLTVAQARTVTLTMPRRN